MDGGLPHRGLLEPDRVARGHPDPGQGPGLDQTRVQGAPDRALVIVRAELIFRRAFKSLQELKGWTDEDILMEWAEVTVPR